MPTSRAPRDTAETDSCVPEMVPINSVCVTYVPAATAVPKMVWPMASEPAAPADTVSVVPVMPPVTLPPTDSRAVEGTVCAVPLTVYDPTPPGPPLKMAEPVATPAPQNFMPTAMVPNSTAVTERVVDPLMAPVKLAAPVPPGQ
jgi:hypothetical protein